MVNTVIWVFSMRRKKIEVKCRVRPNLELICKKESFYCFRIVVLVCFNKMFLSSADNIVYKHIESVYLVFQEAF